MYWYNVNRVVVKHILFYSFNTNEVFNAPSPYEWLLWYHQNMLHRRPRMSKDANDNHYLSNRVYNATLIGYRPVFPPIVRINTSRAERMNTQVPNPFSCTRRLCAWGVWVAVRERALPRYSRYQHVINALSRAFVYWFLFMYMKEENYLKVWTIRP